MSVRTRLAFHAVALAAVFASVTTAKAEEPKTVPDDVLQVASTFDVDPIALAGAVNTTGLDPKTYLCRVGEAPCPAPLISGSVTRAQCLIDEESGGRDIPNARGSGAWGPGQYMPGTWASHVAMYRRATGFVGSLSLHSYNDVLRVMAWVLANVPGSRGAWTVQGC